MTTVTLPAAAFQRLRTAGQLLSNVAKSAAETKGLAISPRCRQSLDDCRHEWDDALEAVQGLLANPPRPASTVCSKCGRPWVNRAPMTVAIGSLTAAQAMPNWSSCECGSNTFTFTPEGAAPAPKQATGWGPNGPGRDGGPGGGNG